MKPIKYIIASLAFLLTGIQLQAQQTPCELDTSYAVPGGNYETLSETYMIETPPDTLFPDTIGDITIDTTEMELEDSTRYVVWVHGLGGNSTAWSNMAAAFYRANPVYPDLSRKLISERVDYSIDENSSTTYSIGQHLYDNKVPTTMQEDLNPDYDPERTILIAHSQGGIVARQMDRYKSSSGIENNFGGFATFATPNQGAQIINNQNMVNAFLFDMADNLTEGPLADIEHNESFWIRMVSNFINAPGLKDKIVDFFADDIGQYLINKNYPKTTEDYSVGASELTELNNYNSESEGIVPFFSRANLLNSIEHESKIRTYEFEIEVPGWCLFPACHEIVPQENTEFVVQDIPVGISLRTLNYFVNSPSEMADFTAQDSLHNFAVRYHETLLDYQANVDRNATIAYGCDACIDLGLYSRKRRRARSRMRAWQKGVDYLNSFDRRYRALTGILESEIDTLYYCDCVESDGHVEVEWTDGPFDEMQDCTDLEDMYTVCSSRYETIRNYFSNVPSDGVVLEESAKEIPQAAHDPVEINGDLELGGATHMELRNTSYTRDAVDKLFKGDYGKYFYTPKYY